MGTKQRRVLHSEYERRSALVAAMMNGRDRDRHADERTREWAVFIMV